jgi:uncharacterized membrane protein YdbT with pleckstrin-like domain
MTRQVIYSGTPSQVINIPAFLKGGVVMALVGAIDLVTRGDFQFQWSLVLVQAAAVMIGVALPFLKTASTEIVIDTGRITWTQGIFSRRTSSLELTRIRHVTVVYPRWQRAFGTGSIVLDTGDGRRPMRRLPGIRHAEELCRKLEAAIAASPELKDEHLRYA